MNANIREVENTAWQVALELAVEHDKNVQRLCAAVLSDDWDTAKKLAKELRSDEESFGAIKSINRGAGRRR